MRARRGGGRRQHSNGNGREQEGRRGGTPTREEGPEEGLTRALKIENSKWPIFPADGTETKSRPAFIMTCIAVRAAVICTVSLQNATWVSANATAMGENVTTDVYVRACVRICAWHVCIHAFRIGSKRGRSGAAEYRCMGNSLYGIVRRIECF